MNLTTRRYVRLLLCSTLAMAGRLGAQDTSAVRVTPQGVLVYFQDADIRLVISALAEAGNLNVSYGDLPAKRITLRMRQPVRREDVPALLRSLAKSNGLQIEEDAGIMRIEPVDAGAARNAATKDEPTGDLRLFVYRLRHARATQLAGTLQSIFGGPGAGSSTTTGRIQRRPLSESLREQQVPPAVPEDSRVRVEVSPSAMESLPGRLQGDVQIVPDEGTNSLVIRADAEDWPVIRQAIESMDLRPLQVLIEVLIIEVQRNRDLNIGIASASRATAKDTASIKLQRGDATNLLASFVTRNGVNINLALNALASRGNIRVLSRPLIFAQNNQEAKIHVGSERPFIQVSRASLIGDAAPLNTIQYKPVGSSLSILPTINPDGYVNLQVQQEVSSATTEVQFGAPVISTRETTTHLFVRDSQTVVIGGLIDRRDERGQSGIPILSSIPGLGVLFGGRSSSQTNSELFLFLTPHIVRDDADADRIRGGVQERTDLLKHDLPAELVIPPPAVTAPAPAQSPPQ